MKKLTLFIMAMYCFAINLTAQFCNNKYGCYNKDSCLSSSQIHTRDYKYATVNNIYKSATASVDLYMTILSPCNLPKKIDSINEGGCKQCKRPFILCIHGGGFRAGCRTAYYDECMEFAKRGYVVATIDYRMGWVPGDEKQTCNQNFCFSKTCSHVQEDSCNPLYKDSLDFAKYRAIQDAAAALRFIAHYANNLSIDTSYLYLTGHSAGSIVAISICYLDQHELNQAIPKAYTVLGAYNRYGNSFKEKYRIEALFNNWGSIDDTIYMKGAKDRIPMIAFHGIDDSIVPFEKGEPLTCNNGAYGYKYGSSLMYQKLRNNYPGLTVELYACYGGHGIFVGNILANPNSLYRIQKAVCFFNRIRNGDTTCTYILIDKNEDDLDYRELNLISPVNCSSKNNNLSAYSKPSTPYNSFAASVKLIVLPNPALSTATLLINEPFKKVNIFLLNASGDILWKKENVEEKAVGIPVKNLNAGLYFVFVKNAEHSAIIKFIKSD